MQQINSIILEGKVIDATEDNECITIEHDSMEGSPVIMNIITEHIEYIDTMHLGGRIIRVTGRLVYNNNDVLIYAEHLEIHPKGV